MGAPEYDDGSEREQADHERQCVKGTLTPSRSEADGSNDVCKMIFGKLNSPCSAFLHHASRHMLRLLGGGVLRPCQGQELVPPDVAQGGLQEDVRRLRGGRYYSRTSVVDGGSIMHNYWTHLADIVS